MRCRTRAEQDAIRNFIEDPKNQNKRLVKEVLGAGYKGSDMTLLWGGCNVPVIDKQMMRYLAPAMLGKDWDSYVRERLSQRKADGLKLRLTLRSGVSALRTIDAEEIDVDNPIHRTSEEEAISGKIQSTVGRYGAWRDLAYQMADAEGIPASIWHVATWLEYRIGGDPDSPRANPKTLAQGRAFVERTYGPSETPGAWYDHHPENRQALIEDGGGYDIIDPVSGQTIHLAEAENSLNYLPPALSRAAPWDDDWFFRSDPQSQDAKFLRQISNDVTDMIHELEYKLMKDDPPLGLEMDRLARRNYNEWRRDRRAYGWPLLLADGGGYDIIDLLPDKIDSLTQLYQVDEKLAQHRMSLQNADRQMLTAIVQAEEEAIQRGVEFTDDYNNWLKGQITPGAYDPELVDRHQRQYRPDSQLRSTD